MMKRSNKKNIRTEIEKKERDKHALQPEEREK
jgi:hypothetical protein